MKKILTFALMFGLTTFAASCSSQKGNGVENENKNNNNNQTNPIETPKPIEPISSQKDWSKEFASKKEELERTINKLAYPGKQNSQAVKDLTIKLSTFEYTDEKSWEDLNKFAIDINTIKENIQLANDKIKKLNEVDNNLISEFNLTSQGNDFVLLFEKINKKLEEQENQKLSKEINKIIDTLPYPSLAGGNEANINNVPAISKLKTLYTNTTETLDEVRAKLVTVAQKIEFFKNELLNISNENQTNLQHNNKTYNLYEVLRDSHTEYDFSYLENLLNVAKTKDKSINKNLINNLSNLKAQEKQSFNLQIENALNYNEIQEVIRNAKFKNSENELKAILQVSDYLITNLASTQVENEIIKNTINRIFSSTELTVNNIKAIRTKLTSYKNKLIEAKNKINEIAANDVENLNDTKRDLFNIIINAESENDFAKIDIEIKKQKLIKLSNSLPYPGKTFENPIVPAISNLNKLIEDATDLNTLNQIELTINGIGSKINNAITEINSIQANEYLSSDEVEQRKQSLLNQLNDANTDQEFVTLTQDIELAKSQTNESYKNNKLRALKSRVHSLPYPGGENAPAINEIINLIDNDSDNFSHWEEKVTDINNKINAAIAKINNVENKDFFNNKLNSANLDSEFTELNNLIDNQFNQNKTRITQEISSLEFLSDQIKNQFIQELNDKSVEEMENVLSNAYTSNIENKINALSYPQNNAPAKAQLLNNLRTLTNKEAKISLLNEVKKLEQVIRQTNDKIDALPYPNTVNSEGARYFKNQLNSLISYNEIENLVPEGLKEKIQEYKNILNSTLNPFPISARDYGLKTRLNSLTSFNSIQENELRWNFYETKRRTIFNTTIDGLAYLSNDEKAALKNEVISIPDANKHQPINDFNTVFHKLDQVILKAQKENVKKHIDLITYPSQQGSLLTRNSLKSEVNDLADDVAINAKNAVILQIKNKMAQVRALTAALENSPKLNDINTSLDNVSQMSDFSAIELKIKQTKYFDRLNLLTNLSTSQKQGYEQRIFSAQTDQTLQAIIDEATLQNKKEDLYRIIDQITYPTPNSSQARSSLSKLRTRINGITTDQEFTQERTTLIEFKTALENKVRKANELTYPTRNALAKSEIITGINSSTTVAELNRILPDSWNDDVVRYKELIISQFGRTSGLLSRLDKTHYSKTGTYRLGELNNQILLTKKNAVKTQIQNLSNLTVTEKNRFKGNVDNIQNTGANQLPNNAKLLEIDRVYFEARKQSLSNKVDTLGYPNEARYSTHLAQTKREIKALLNNKTLHTELDAVDQILNKVQNSITTINSKINQVSNETDKNEYKEKLSQANHEELNALLEEINLYIEVNSMISSLSYTASNNADGTLTQDINTYLNTWKSNLNTQLNSANSQTQLLSLKQVILKATSIWNNINSKFNANYQFAVKSFVAELRESTNTTQLTSTEAKITPFYNELNTFFDVNGLKTLYEANQNNVTIDNVKYKPYNTLLNEIKNTTNASLIRELNGKKDLYAANIEYTKVDKNNIPNSILGSHRTRMLNASTSNGINQVRNDLVVIIALYREVSGLINNLGKTSNRTEFSNTLSSSNTTNALTALKTSINSFSAKYSTARNKINEYNDHRSHDAQVTINLESELDRATNETMLDTLIRRIDEEIENLNAGIQRERLINSMRNWSLSSDILEHSAMTITVETNDTKFRTLKEELEALNTSLNTLLEVKAQSENLARSSSTNSAKVLAISKELTKFNKLFTNDKLNWIDLGNIQANINSLDALTTTLRNANNSNVSSNKTLETLMLEETQNIFTFEKTQNAKSYNFNEHETPGSFTLDNSNLFFDNHDTDLYDYSVVNLELKGTNLETLEATIEVTLKTDPSKKVRFKKVKHFNTGVKSNLDSINLRDLEDIYTIDYDKVNSYTQTEWNTLTQEQQNEVFTKIKTGLNNYFKYDIKVKSTLDNNKLRSTVSILFNNQVLKTIQLNSRSNIAFRATNETKQAYWDRINLNKVLNIVNNSNVNHIKSDFFNNLSFKNHDKIFAHNDFLASQAREKFEELYNMPTFGKYQIFIKDIYNINDYKGEGYFVLWYKENGVEAPGYDANQRRSKMFRIDGFLLQNFYDIRPKGEHFTVADFKSSEFTEPTEEIKGIANSINESNFEWRHAVGKSFGYGHRANQYFRSLNAKNFMQQKAYLNFEYLIKMINGKDSKGTNNVNVEYDRIGNTALYDKDITVNSRDITKLKNEYYRYFYDFILEDDRSLSFKIGYIKKENQNIRYTNEVRYRLINLVNDFEQTLYPEVIVNNVKHSDLIVNMNEIRKRSISWYKQNMSTLRQHIKVRANNQNRIVYNNYWINQNSIYVTDIKRINRTEAYIRLQANAFNTNNGVNFKADIWYKISGFKADNGNKKEQLVFNDNNLNVVYDSNTSVWRKRLIEPYWRDLMWTLDKNNIATWTLDKKYIDKTLLQPNTTNRKVRFTLFGNILFNDNSKNERIRNESNVPTFELDLDQLIQNKYFKLEVNTPTVEGTTFKYNIVAEWTEKGIKLKIYTLDSSYKIVIDEPEVQKFGSSRFDKNKAFLILPAASKIWVSYTNNKEHEDFGVTSNKFDYNDIEYTENEEPILFSNETSFLNNEVYYPNQNVNYKLHEGYKLHTEQLRKRKNADWDSVKVAYSRALLDDGGTVYGSLSIIGKVNNDPNDYKFYVSTNKHVQRVNNFEEISGANLLKEVTRKKFIFAPITSTFNPTPYNIQAQKWVTNDILRVHNNRNVRINKIEGKTINIIWSGLSQISNDGTTTNNQVDYTVYVIDLKNDYIAAKRDGWMNIVWKIENLMKNPNVKLDIDYKHSQISVPNIREISNMAWPNTKYATQLFRRFSPNKFVSSANSRTYFGDSWIQWQQQMFQPQYYGGGGASGSGLFFADGSYAGAWNSGASGANEGYFAQGPKYATRTYNYFGVNFEGEDPLSLRNTNSLAAQIIRANLKNPNDYDLPWFFKERK
ncbi:MGA_1079 family surface serine endopeptidase [Mycoplasmopsis edwardii]|nr:GA module-containing protein [Mycoplasmopsis edwardii]